MINKIMKVGFDLISDRVKKYNHILDGLANIQNWTDGVYSYDTDKHSDMLFSYGNKVRRYLIEINDVEMIKHFEEYYQECERYLRYKTNPTGVNVADQLQLCINCNKALRQTICTYRSRYIKYVCISGIIGMIIFVFGISYVLI